MESRGSIKFLPIGGIIDRYLAQGFLRIFFASLVGITALYLIVDFFDRIGIFVDTGVPISTIIRYNFYNAPLSISRVIGFATLFSALFCLGTLARTQEITAIRSSGISVQRIAVPLLILSLIICVFTFFWNETIVPIFAHRAQTIYKTEVKNKKQQSLFGTRDIWIRGDGSFINIDNFDPQSNVLEHLTIFLLNRDFSLRGIMVIGRARWNGRGWEATDITEWKVLSEGKMVSQKVPDAPLITETPEDLKLLARDPEEFTYFDLQKQISDMKSKGMETRFYEVDLQAKLAFPLISPLVVLIAIPFALKKQVSGSMALSFGSAMIIAFGYWVLSAFCLSLGHSGALPAWIAAWVPNSIFGLIGIFYFTAEQ
jgi:lipopolysaccharide export system permease protein